MQHRAGTFQQQLTGDMAYHAFVPAPLPPVPPVELSQDTLNLLVAANKLLAKLDAAAAHVPDMGQFIGMYVRKEALLSSQIEGTQATLEDILDPALDVNLNRNAADVINYIQATEYAINRLDTLPLCNRLIRETHAVLMDGVRGQERQPGAFRISQNWIGAQGSTLKSAVYVPPTPDDMLQSMTDLERYIHTDDTTDALIRAALIHYQFETIHPFLDGNGRVGRLLITLYLMEKQALSAPVLYISYFLKRNRVEYYDRMMDVRLKGTFEQWVAFFLRAVRDTAEDALETIARLSQLHEDNLRSIRALGRGAPNAERVFLYLERTPIMDIGKTAQALGVAYNTVSAAVKRLEALNIVVPSSDQERNRTFVYRDYLDVLRKDT